MQEYLSQKPFDLYALHLFQLVVKHRNFTRAARAAGLSQSALTRQMQSLEERLGIDLINRTTRSVEITEAGEFLAIEAGRLVGSVAATLDALQANYGAQSAVLRVGVSRSMAMAHLPGLFHAFQKRHPQVITQVSYQLSSQIVTALDEHSLDVGIFCPPNPMPPTLVATHRFRDTFALIASRSLTSSLAAKPRQDRLLDWLNRQPWLLIDDSGTTGTSLRSWLRSEGILCRPAMELDSFDVIINLVAAGMGVAMVPQRALALYRRKQSIVRLPMKAKFHRELVIATRKHRKLPQHIADFVAEVLF
jgi:DNA-binding transcriptional LysR family regulator